VGFSGDDTGLGLSMLKAIPRNTYACACAPTATMQVTPQTVDFVQRN